MAKVNKHGQGHHPDARLPEGTAHALPEILAQLKAGGFKVVHMVPKERVKTLPQYDEVMIKDQKLPTVSQRPTSSVVKTISEVPGRVSLARAAIDMEMAGLVPAIFVAARLSRESCLRRR